LPVWHLRTPSVFRVNCGSRRIGRHVNHAVFRRESFVSRSLGCPQAFASCKPSAPSGWESLPEWIWTLTSPVGHTMQLRGFHLSPLRLTSPPKERRPACRATQSWSPACLLRLTVSQPRMPSIDSISILRRRVADWSKSRMKPTSQLEHPCHSSEPPAGQGDGTPARAVLTRATVATACAATNGDLGERRCLSPISATNLLSTSTPETHQLSCARLSPS
jgi:hypothetical protein